MKRPFLLFVCRSVVSNCIFIYLLTVGCALLFTSFFLFSSSQNWCCCSPHCPKTLESAGILVQPCEKLPSSQLLPIFCKSHLSLPFISGPHLPQFIFQQVSAIIASSTGCACALLTRLWLPFSGCIYFSFLLHLFLLSSLFMSRFWCPVHLSLGLSPCCGHSLLIPSHKLFPLLEISPVPPLAEQLNPYQYGPSLFPFKSWFSQVISPIWWLALLQKRQHLNFPH